VLETREKRVSAGTIRENKRIVFLGEGAFTGKQQEEKKVIPDMGRK
jgi:hypothetical protein